MQINKTNIGLENSTTSPTADGSSGSGRLRALSFRAVQDCDQCLFFLPGVEASRAHRAPDPHLCLTHQADFRKQRASGVPGHKQSPRLPENFPGNEGDKVVCFHLNVSVLTRDFRSCQTGSNYL